MSDTSMPFLTDVKVLRDRARQHLEEGVVTPSYEGDARKTIEILQSVLATELVCVLRYTMHSISATGISSEGVKKEFAERKTELQSGRFGNARCIPVCGRRGSGGYDPGKPHR
jgi:bacterioferritin